MPDWLFPLPVFPVGSLSSSVITTVWVGIYIIAFFNLRFGWVLSGIVVPGYLVPLLIARPLSFGVIIVEASVTYGLVWFFSERMSGGRTWSSLFGRDRFVGLVLASILVRLTFDGWLLPAVVEIAEQELGIGYDLRGNLHSFGLIVIALLANQLWKPGYLRGMYQALVIIGLTYLVVRFGLMELTNFRISAVSYLYEDVASSILASPKAYIILVVTVLIASRMNLRYGWDFSGVLIPALIALQWYQLPKILTSFVEAFAIYGIAVLILRLPLFANTTIEGARKILLFFNISFAYRLIIGHALYWTGSDVQVTDYYGFGYLLSTLIAIKIFEKDILLRLTRAILQTSLLGAALGTMTGFALFLLLPVSPVATKTNNLNVPRIVVVREMNYLDFVAEQTVAVYASESRETDMQPDPAEVEAFRAGMRLIVEDDATIEEGALLLNDAGFEVQLLDGNIIAVTDALLKRGGGTYLVNPDVETGIVISIPDPLEAPGLAVAGAFVMQQTGARALAMGGRSASLTGNGTRPLEQDRFSFFQAFHEVASGSVLRLAGDGMKGDDARLRIPSRMPAGLDSNQLEQLVGPIEVTFGRDGKRLIQENAAGAGFATLHLTVQDVAHLLAKTMPDTLVIHSEGGFGRYIYKLAAASLDDKSARKPHELLFFDREILNPLITEVVPALGNRAEIPVGLLAPVRRAASVVGYEVIIHESPVSEQRQLVLSPVAPGRGLFVFGAGERAPYVIQVPRPVRDLATLEYAATLYDDLLGSALLVPEGQPPEARSGTSALKSRSGTLEAQPDPTFFDLVSQVLLRESTDRSLMIVQARGFSSRTAEALPYDALVAFSVMPANDRLTELGEELRDAVAANSARAGVLQGEPETAGLEVGVSRQARYLDAVHGGEFAVVWLSPTLQTAYRTGVDPSQAALFASLNITTVDSSPLRFLEQRIWSAESISPDLVETVLAYQSRRDVVALQHLQQTWILKRINDSALGLSFLAILDDAGAVLALLNLAPRDPESRIELDLANTGLSEAVGKFVSTRAGWLILGPMP